MGDELIIRFSTVADLKAAQDAIAALKETQAATGKVAEATHQSTHEEMMNSHEKRTAIALIRSFSHELGRIPGAMEAIHVLKHPITLLAVALGYAAEQVKKVFDEIEEAAKASVAMQEFTRTIEGNRLELNAAGLEAKEFAKALKEAETGEHELGKETKKAMEAIANQGKEMNDVEEAAYEWLKKDIQATEDAADAEEDLMALEEDRKRRKIQASIDEKVNEAKAHDESAARNREAEKKALEEVARIKPQVPSYTNAATKTETGAKAALPALEKEIKEQQDKIRELTDSVNARQAEFDAAKRKGQGVSVFEKAVQERETRELAERNLKLDVAISRKTTFDLSVQSDKARAEQAKKELAEAEARAKAAAAAALKDDEAAAAARAAASSRISTQRRIENINAPAGPPPGLESRREPREPIDVNVRDWQHAITEFNRAGTSQGHDAWARILESILNRPAPGLDKLLDVLTKSNASQDQRLGAIADRIAALESARRSDHALQ